MIAFQFEIVKTGKVEIVELSALYFFFGLGRFLRVEKKFILNIVRALAQYFSNAT